MRAPVLVAGVGNVFLSDDGFGVEVARRLGARQGELPPDVEVADVGIRGMHLAYRLLDGYDTVVLVDTTRRGGAPGRLYLLEHDLDRPTDDLAVLDSHRMDPVAVLAMLNALAEGVGVARPVRRVLVVGCEPLVLDEGLGLSEPVAAAVDRAVRAVIDLLDELLASTDTEMQGERASQRAPRARRTASPESTINTEMQGERASQRAPRARRTASPKSTINTEMEGGRDVPGDSRRDRRAAP